MTFNSILLRLFNKAVVLNQVEMTRSAYKINTEILTTILICVDEHLPSAYVQK